MQWVSRADLEFRNSLAVAAVTPLSFALTIGIFSGIRAEIGPAFITQVMNNNIFGKSV
jgi:hypothetical protein